MRRMAAADPFAIRTMTSGGEKIAFSDPTVSDAQRAAAGRETVAERMRALLPENRQRGATAYASGGLPDGQEVLRVWRQRDPAGLRERLGDSRQAVWAEDDVLNVLWRGEAEQVLLSGGVQVPLWPVDGADGLWEASLRVRRLDEAVITVMVIGLGAADLPFGRPVPEAMTWRGPRAPALPSAGLRLAGEVRSHTIESAALRGPRDITVYVPPGTGDPLPGCLLADGQSVTGFAQVLEPAIAAGLAPPVLLVGMHHAVSRPEGPDLRGQEYLPGYRPRRFAAHLSFAIDEVIPWASGSLPSDGARRWIAAGFSNGAAWAIGAAQRRPEVFGGVAAFSAGVVPRRVSAASRDVRHYLAAGALEEGFRSPTLEWATRLRRVGVPCHHHEWAGGHDPFWWHRSLPDALAWLLRSAGKGAGNGADDGADKGAGSV